MGDKNINGPDDESLVRAAQSGDLEAFGELYQRYFTIVYRYTLARVHDRLTAEDTTEKVFLKIFQNLDQYKDLGCRFSTYMYRVTKNLIIDYYRLGAKQPDFLDETQVEQVDARDLDADVIRSERLQRILRVMENLPAEYQEVIRLRILLGLPTTAVASWMGRSPGSVRVLLHRALKQLRTLVGESGEEF